MADIIDAAGRAVLADPGAASARLGAELRAARERLGWRLPDLAASLRIRLAYLEAIEGGRIGELPGNTYALGFVRTYADALGFAGDEVARRFRTEGGAVPRKTDLSFPVPVPQRGVPAGAILLVGLLIAAGAYVGWYRYSSQRQVQAQTVPPIPDRLAGLAPERAPPSPQVATILPSASPPAPVTPAPGGSVATPAPAVPPSTPPAPAPAPVAATPAPLPPAAPQAGSPVGTGRMVLKFSADAWVSVKPPTGPAVLNKLMHAGDTWPVPADPPGLLLTTGNAGGTELDVDGTPVAGMGGSGAVRRNLVLDPDALKSAPLPPIGHARARPADVPTPVTSPPE